MVDVDESQQQYCKLMNGHLCEYDLNSCLPSLDLLVISEEFNKLQNTLQLTTMTTERTC